MSRASKRAPNGSEGVPPSTERVRLISPAYSDANRTVVGAKRRSGVNHEEVSEMSQGFQCGTAMDFGLEARSYSQKTPPENDPRLRRRAESFVSNSVLDTGGGGPKDFLRRISLGFS